MALEMPLPTSRPKCNNNLKHQLHVLSKIPWRLLNNKSKQISHLENSCYLKTLSESDVHQSYNRRDIVKIFNLKMSENKEYNETIDKVLEVIDQVEAVVKASDISIAHHLPGKRNPMIVKFN